jgi:hypothetical protein
MIRAPVRIPGFPVRSVWEHAPMRAKFLSAEPAISIQRWLTGLRKLPKLVLASYFFALLGARFAIHDFHNYTPYRFGLSTPLLALAILLYLFGQKRPTTRPRR